eukprot:8246601-Alexandrium_andersonii.AAC.1
MQRSKATARIASPCNTIVSNGGMVRPIVSADLEQKARTPLRAHRVPVDALIALLVDAAKPAVRARF